MILDVVRGNSKDLLRRGSARAEIREKDSPKKRETRVREAVTLMLVHFPPTK